MLLTTCHWTMEGEQLRTYKNNILKSQECFYIKDPPKKIAHHQKHRQLSQQPWGGDQGIPRMRYKKATTWYKRRPQYAKKEANRTKNLGLKSIIEIGT